jgi:hypothetical protein
VLCLPILIVVFAQYRIRLFAFIIIVVYQEDYDREKDGKVFDDDKPTLTLIINLEAHESMGDDEDKRKCRRVN